MMHVQQLARSCFLGRGCCDNPSGTRNGANMSLVYFFSVEFTSECFQRVTELFCGALGDALGDREGGEGAWMASWPPRGAPRAALSMTRVGRVQGCWRAATSHGSLRLRVEWFSWSEDIIPLHSYICAHTEVGVLFVCLSKLKQLILQWSAGGLGRAIATRHCCLLIKHFK